MPASAAVSAARFTMRARLPQKTRGCELGMPGLALWKAGCACSAPILDWLGEMEAPAVVLQLINPVGAS